MRTFTTIALAVALCGCSNFSFSKFTKPVDDGCGNENNRIANVPDGCLVTYGESGCTKKPCEPKPEAPRVQYYTHPLPLHMYGYSRYQARYGSAMPPNPTIHVVVPVHNTAVIPVEQSLSAGESIAPEKTKP